ncbi:hypothetical protein [Nesterenkonia sp. CF4.4]|uniref:hypothetical protein n=1 Tax=Nesterenkonia sp. CF4.4 TaxID=3373079 RepID=UPI003EE5FC94
MATCILVLTPALLMFGPIMVVTVVPALAGLVLLWTRTSSAYIRRVSDRASGEAEDSVLESLVNSDSSGPRVPWANSMPGNPHQPGI